MEAGDKNHLAQVKTGQGKSVILGVLATVLSLKGFSVDCVCYSQYLSERDQSDFEEVFRHFGVENQVMYGTFQQLSEKLVNEDGDVRKLTESFFVPDSEVGSGANSYGSVQGKRGGRKRTGSGEPPRVLLIDEVDVFFSHDFYGETYNPVLPLKLDPIAELQKLAWSMQSADAHAIQKALLDTGSYKSLVEKYAGVRKVLDSQINKMVRDLDAWKNAALEEPFRAYKLIDGKVAYKSGVCYDTKISFDYVTLWTYFFEHDNGRVSDGALNEHLGLLIKCGQFSYAEIPKRYKTILGVTGTLVPETPGGPHPLGQFEQNIIRDEYKIKGQTDLPSVFGEKKLTFRENEHVSVQTDEESYYNAISLEVATALEGRAVLVFFESEAKLQAWYDSPYGQRVAPGIMDTITSETRHITMKVRKATHSGKVTLLSREHGRGLDFHCTDKTVEKMGGLHVVQTFLSEELSEEIQIRGRTARQKNKGSFQMILLAQDLDKFEVTAEEIKEKEKGLAVATAATSAPVAPPPAPTAAGATAPSAAPLTQTMYAFLHEKRALFLEKSAQNRNEAALCALQQHTQTTRFQKALLKVSRNAATALAREKSHAECLQFLIAHNTVSAKCRLVCLSDATGSMSHVWKRTQDSIRIMLERIAEISGGTGNIEIKWVAYRDYELPRSMLLEPSEWTDDPASLVRFVGGIKCRSGQGCDGPEAVEAALHHVNNEPDPPTRVLLIGDAPGHHERKGTPLKQCKPSETNQQQGALVEGGVLQTDWQHECKLLKEKDVKVFPLYIGDYAKEQFEQIAVSTGGESSPLDPAEKEGLVHAVCETALEDIGGSAMQEKYRAQYRK